MGKSKDVSNIVPARILYRDMKIVRAHLLYGNVFIDEIKYIRYIFYIYKIYKNLKSR